MLQPADYLRVTKRRLDCAECGRSFVESERHPSVLVEPQEEEKPAEPQTQEETPPAEETPEPPKAEKSGKKKKKGKKEKKQEEEEEPAFQRFDYCPKCWETLKESAFFSFWIGRRTESDLPPKKLNRLERNLALQALFDSLAEREDPEADFTPHLFFLAHLLMKYKLFKWLPGIDDPDTGHPMLRFSRPDLDEEIRIPEVDMPPETIVQIKGEIEAYLEQSTGQVIRL